MSFAGINLTFALGLALAVGIIAFGFILRPRWPRELDPVVPRVKQPERFFAFGALLLFFLLIALARPQWGASESSASESAECWIILDVSRSMLATVQGSTRLQDAIEHAKQSVEQLAGHDVGIIAFAGEAKVLSPPTKDHEHLQQILSEVTIDAAPPGGSDLLAAAQLVDHMSAGPTFAWLFSDGGSDDEISVTPVSNQSLVLSTIGLGNPTEETAIPRAPGQPPILENRQPVMSRLREGPLRSLAEAYHGSYQRAERDRPVTLNFGPLVEAEKGQTSPRDLSVWFLAPGALLALLLTYRQGALCLH